MSKPKFRLHLWHVYERIILDLLQLNNIVQKWHYVFNNGVSFNHHSCSKLVQCILRQQSRFEIDIERTRPCEQSKKKKKVCINLDERLKKIMISYDVKINIVEKYLIQIAMHLIIIIEVYWKNCFFRISVMKMTIQNFRRNVRERSVMLRRAVDVKM